MGRHTRATQRSRGTSVQAAPQPRILKLSEYRRRNRRRLFATGLKAFFLVFLVGVVAVLWRPTLPAFALSGVLPDNGSKFTCTVVSVTDGDTFRCREQDSTGRAIRVRLSGVAARETDGSCSPGHPCPTASADAATAELQRLAHAETLTCRAVGETYGRVAGFCATAEGTDLSCAMVESGTVLKWRKYWGLHRCP